jgi:uncharacterized protein YdaU (DUF1376 family)
MHYYQFHIGDYKSHTHHLSLIEDLAYRRLLDHYYLHESPIKQRDIARQIGMRDHEQEVLTVLDEFFISAEDGFIHPRADAEINKFKEFAEAGKRGAAKRWLKGGDGEANSPPNATPIATINHKPITNNHKPKNKTVAVVQRPDSVSQQVWDDWLSVRKKKGASSLSQTAWDKVVSEVQISGWTFEDAISECCLRNWIGFKAEWVADKQGSNKTVSFAQQERELGWKRWEEMTGREHPDRLAHEGKRPNQFIDIQATDILEIGK